MFVAIAMPTASCWSEPIIGLTMESVINEVLDIYESPDVMVIEGNSLILKWDDEEVADEEWYIGEYIAARRQAFEKAVRDKQAMIFHAKSRR